MTEQNPNLVYIVRLFSRQTLSATVITPVSTPNHSNSPSPAGSRSRANSYDLECYKELAKEYESNGKLYFGDMKQ